VHLLSVGALTAVVRLLRIRPVGAIFVVGALERPLAALLGDPLGALDRGRTSTCSAAWAKRGRAGMAAEPQEVLARLGRRLTAERIRAVVPRNYERLPEQLRGDLDLFVHPQDLARARGLTKTVADEAGWRVLLEQRSANHHQTVLLRTGEYPGPPETLFLDLQDSLGRKGFHYASVEPFLERPRQRNGFAVPRPAAATVALALHVLLDKGRLREDYARRLRSADLPSVATFAAEVLPAPAACSLAAWLDGGAPEAGVRDLAARLRRSLLRAHPTNAVAPWIERIRSSLPLLGRRRGVLVAFLGPDGAGKSTLIEALKRAAPDGPFPFESVYLGKRDPFLPTSRLIRRIHRRGERRRAERGPTRQRLEHDGLRYRLKDVAGLANWFFEQWARHWIHVRLPLQRGGVVLTDRCAFDFGNREDASWAHRPWFRRLLPHLFPLPDLTYLLWEDPEVLFERKGELEPERAAAFLERFRAILRHVPRSREIRTNQPAHLLAEQILREIVARLERRWSR
jgi:thymidylate kinase